MDGDVIWAYTWDDEVQSMEFNIDYNFHHLTSIEKNGKSCYGYGGEALMDAIQERPLEVKKKKDSHDDGCPFCFLAVCLA